MAFGISYDEFWKLNPRKLNVIIAGFKTKRKVRDEENWMLGGYVFEALTIALNNAFRKKGQKAKEYFDLCDTPIMQRTGTAELSEAEKKKQTELLFKSLEIQMANFNLQKK